MQSLCAEKAVDKDKKKKGDMVGSSRDLDGESAANSVVGGPLSAAATAAAAAKTTRGLAAAGILVLVLVLVVVVVGAFCWLALRQAAILRLETELLKLRMRSVEDRVEQCNALLLAAAAAKTATRADDAQHHRQSPPVSLFGSRLVGDDKTSSSSSSSSSSLTSLEASYSRLSRLKRNAEKKHNNNNNNKNNKNAKTKAKTQKPEKVVANFETDHPLPCKQSNCLSLTGWKPSSWVESSLHRHFDELSGRFDVPVDGIYYLYAQVTYNTVAALEAYAIMVDADHQMAKCMTGVDYVTPGRDFANNAQSKSCHTGTTAHLRKGQKVWLKSFHMGDSVSVLSMRHTSFWGVVKL